ncbi:hypothetical protein J6590_063826 [Homalodisca vitripennis]|nr:hypothetical protein J6590_063826 [Homalodisca vitripennis]
MSLISFGATEWLEAHSFINEYPVTEREAISQLNLERHFESSVTSAPALNHVMAVYRPPDGDSELSFDRLEDAFRILITSKSRVIVCDAQQHVLSMNNK